ncbi:MAG TPA: ROK family protein [Candidatus Limnocylindria bacterium]|jgi:predicted NBD/HSP70 family sugar kinase|nr:ROK family protein [Candidatus Limnocylindria bacterium]
MSDFFRPVPQFRPVLDPQFCPAVLARRAFAREATVPLGLAIEQADGTVIHHWTKVLHPAHSRASANDFFIERLAKFLLWSVGGWRIWVEGSKEMAQTLGRHYRNTAVGRFDSEIVGERIYDHPITVVHTDRLPDAKVTVTPLGRHLGGCRIGFDLGGSDRKTAALIDGQVVFSEETTWDPYFQADPQYHVDGIMDSLRKAAAHLPRVDAIGGSAAGVYVNNRVKVASLFRGVSKELFETRVKDLFVEIRREWKGIPLDVVNDGEVTALAASMSLGINSVLGLSLGTSTAGGFVNADGNITPWLNELAFAPIDYREDAPADEWSGDLGCGVQYFSQQAVGRLLAPAGIEIASTVPLPEKLKHVQKLMGEGDPRALKIYQTIGVYLGYGLAHYADFYDLRHVLILGRVTSGEGGEVILDVAREVIKTEFPELAARLAFHIPDEKEKRHGQAIAAASLPSLS